MSTYNVYHAADGCGETYLGKARNLRDARKMAARGGGLSEAAYATAEAAGHCAGYYAPDKSHETTDVRWMGRRGEYAAVRLAE